MTNESPARLRFAQPQPNFCLTTEGMENTEYQRLDDGAIRLNSRFPTDRILFVIPSMFSVPSVVENAICVLPLTVPEHRFRLQLNFFVPREDSDRQ